MPGKLRGRAAMAAAAILAASAAGADVCLTDAWNNGTVQAKYLFPNWTKAEVASFDVQLCLGCAGASEILNGLTVVNFAGGAAANLAGVSWRAVCGATDTGFVPMTFAGSYTEDSGTYPAWTWNGASLNLAGCPDLCGGLCGGYFTLSVYADVAACPVPGDRVALGFPINQANNPMWWGSIVDGGGCAVPWYDMAGPSHTIVYAYKEGPAVAAPGDTVMYTITYGRPGTGPLTGIEIMDTLPPWTHYAAGTGSPAPDAGFDPDPGPPLRLRWSLGGGPVAGGPTGQVSFGLTVDWGNGESFEPGSGDVAAPEMARLDNRAQVAYGGIAGCAVNPVVTPPVTTVVRRFLFWKVGDNDVLYSQSLGQPPDEMTYEIFVRNMSGGKTWWNVQIWDTVPAEISPWATGLGFDDPCLGWTMTPSGCAAASPGRLVNGGTTLLTWNLDLLPGATLSLRWKAAVTPTSAPGATAVGIASILALGRTGVVNGTGPSGAARSFSHLAPVILPTTYVSYVGLAGADDTCYGFFITFFPLNKKTQFELRGIQYQGAGWSTAGGVSQSIGCLIGDCLGGFPGSAGCTLGAGAINGGGNAGCKVERIPARYLPATPCLTYPSNQIYKLTSNAPVLWQLLTEPTVTGDDNAAMAPAATMSYTGMMHYCWRRYFDATAGGNDSLGLISTAKDAYGGVNAALPTTVHLFMFDYAALKWNYVRTHELAGESQAYDLGTKISEEGAWRIMSSDVQLMVNHSFNISDEYACCCGLCANDFATYFPTRETGNTVSATSGGSPLPATFYGYVQRSASLLANTADHRAIIGNTGTALARYEIWRYLADNQIAPPPMPALLNGTSGTWVQVGLDTLPAGIATPGNSRLYNRDGSSFDGKSLGLYKIKLLSGGPIQVLGGCMIYAPHAGGSVIQAADGAQTGVDFWLHHSGGDVGSKSYNCGTGAGFTSTQTINVYCPVQGMVVRAVNQTGYDSTYTTTGPDQCVSFTALTDPADRVTNNYRVTVVPGLGNATAQFIECKYSQKGYTAPFLQTGDHYVIIAPPVVFSGQSFWITVVVLAQGGATKTGYTGLTSFTSTDRSALLEALPMDGYDYQWVPANAGVKMFFKVTLTALGLQSIVAMDTVDGSITGITAIMVVGADVKLTKIPPLQVSASGDAVQFRICWSNYSTATATGFTITDAVPDGAVYLPDAATNHLCGATNGVAGITTAYSTDGGGAYVTMPAAGPGAAAVSRLRWTVPSVGVRTTGCACFRVTVQ